MQDKRAILEDQLNDLNPARRREALDRLLELVDRGDVELPAPGHAVNLHWHTFFSFNGYGYSPSYLAWKARCAGLYAGGVIDFDVLDAADEFLEASARVGLRGCAGVETRAFVRQFETREINSPGEPGVTYHIGVGFTSGDVADTALLGELKGTAQKRNREVLARVNPYLAPVTLDYEKDVLALTPNGNATERHLCTAFNTKAQDVFPDAKKRAAFWAEKLGGDPAKLEAMLDDAPALQALIRAKTMKSGGVGYVKPSGGDFPPLERINEFILSAGAIPLLGWLDGTSAGEQAIDELIDVMLEGGAAAVNLIPDRNWNIKDPAAKKLKLAKLYEFVDLARARHLPIIVGTEMNAYGQKFVDDFDAPELQPLIPFFLEGAQIVYAHTALQRQAGMGYLSRWAADHFESVEEKNEFFAFLGDALQPGEEDILSAIGPDMAPEEIITAVVDAEDL